MYRRMSESRSMVAVKIGGRFFANRKLLGNFADELHRLSKEFQFLVIHGGGNEVTELSGKLGLEPVFKDGVRITTPEEMDIVEAVLSGGVNKRLVRLFRSKGIDAVGLCGADGSIFVGKSLGVVEGINTRTGKIVKVNPRLIEILFDNGYMPVISSTSTELDGKALNINADTVAFHLAESLVVERLIFISDVPGINRNGEIMDVLKTSEIEREISEGVITGGMIPKVRASLDALKGGISGIVIGDYRVRGDLERLIKGKRGTLIE